MGTLASLVAGLGTAVGSFLVFFIRRLSNTLENMLLSVAAGIMLAASFFSLLLPAIGHAESQWGAKPLGVAVVIAELLLGALVIHLMNRYAPHEHFITGHEGPDATTLKRLWLFVIAITIHNFPEGMAVGVGFGGGDIDNGIALATGIGLQNVPEGLAVSVSLLAARYSRAQAFAIGALTGLVEPVGGLFGSVAVWAAAPLDAADLGVRGGGHAVRHQRRDHSRNPPPGP
jgi:ZIP family zinc transporter